MLIDLHNHTSRFSACSIISPEELIDSALCSGLNGIAITEHDQWFDERTKEKLQERAGAGLRIFIGIEHAVPGFHILSFGEQLPTGPWNSIEALDEAASGQDVALILAHPWRWGATARFHDETEQLAFFRHFDAIEVASHNLSPEEQRLGQEFCSRFAIPTCAGSDTHSLSMSSTYATRFEREISTITELAAALRKGSYHPEKL